MDKFQYYLHLAYPLIFIIGGIGVVITAIIGSPKNYEDSQHPGMQTQIEKLGKTKTRILHAVMGLVLIGIGLWLLRGWLFVQQ